MDDFKVIYRVLKFLRHARHYCEEFPDGFSAAGFGLTDVYWERTLEVLAENGFVNGVSVNYAIDGRVSILLAGPRITLKGLEYLQENSLMKKAARTAQGIANMIP